jgi:hypothetical protein
MRLEKGCLVFEKYLKGRPSKLDEPIDKLLLVIDNDGPNHPDFEKRLEELNKLYQMKALEPKGFWSRFSADTVLIVVGGVVQVLIIVGYEHVHVVASKALGFVPKFKSP